MSNGKFTVKMQGRGYTIATHNGSTVARDHNTRNRKITDKEAHIDPGGVYEIWHDEKPQQAYRRLFADAVERYNAKQKRDDRKITNYYRAICKDSKKHPVYEMIISIGNTDNPPDPSTAKAIMRDFVDGWKDRNPNLEMIGAYYHADEKGVPHVHIDYIPVAHGYRRGMDTQTAITKALGEQGFTKAGPDTAQIQWQRRENRHLEALCRARGIRVDHPQEKAQEHAQTAEYQRTREAERLQERADQLREVVERRQRQIEKLKKDRERAGHELAIMESEKNQRRYDAAHYDRLLTRFNKLLEFCRGIRFKNGRNAADLFLEAERKERHRAQRANIDGR